MSINVKGLADFQSVLARYPEESGHIARDIVNGATRYAYAASSREMRAQINFTQDYIGGYENGNRLKVVRRATETVPESLIRATQRPVSLARFALNRTVLRRTGVNIQLRRGRRVQLKTAFLIKLKSGKNTIADQFNIGLVVRLPKGQTELSNKYGPSIPYSKDDPSLFLLYGPSVDQVFQGVREQIRPGVENYLTREGLRQFERYFRGR